MSSPLVEIAKQKKQKWLNYCLERENWGKKIEKLYDQIIEWIEPLEKEGIIKYEMTREGYSPEEEPPLSFLLGITFFNDETILFRSEEFEVVGAYGRIDMDFGERNIMIILKDKESDWIFTERYGLEKTPTYDFNQENFEQILTEFVESFS
jgi:hypothetical protein